LAAGPRRRPSRRDARSSEFSDAEGFGSNVPPAGGSASFLQIAGGRPFSGRTTRFVLHEAAVTIGELDVATLSRGAVDPGRVVVLLPLRAAEPCLWNGQRVNPGDVLTFGPGAEHYGANPAGLRFALVSVPTRAFRSACVAVSGDEWKLERGEVRVARPPASVAEGLRAGQGRRAAIASGHPGRPAARAALRAAERSLIVEIARRFDGAAAHRQGARVRVDRAAVLRRAEVYLEQRLDDPVYLADLCTAARVGERTLESIFQESYGLTPVRYLKLRRLAGARRALTRAEHGSVAEVALAFGFWHFGHFGADYKALFGEAPSSTLARSLR
jgi:AraC family ethanolamine operon transcriptional activator